MLKTIAFSLFLVAFLSGSATAQGDQKRFTPITITTPEVLVDAGDLRSNGKLWKAARKYGFDRKQLKMMRWYGQKQLRPKHLQGRFHEEERPYFSQMQALELLVEGDMALVMLAGPENEHLPAEIRPIADLYMVIPTNAYKPARPWDVLPDRSNLRNGPEIKGLSKVKLNDPSKIYGQFSLRTNEMAQATLKVMMVERQVDHVNYRSNESGWPTGMNSLAERQNLSEHLRSYKAYSLMEFEGKRVLIIPARKNRRVKRNVRPLADIYLVVKTN